LVVSRRLQNMGQSSDDQSNFQPRTSHYPCFSAMIGRKFDWKFDALGCPGPWGAMPSSCGLHCHGRFKGQFRFA
jgi:hypothetical protein